MIRDTNSIKTKRSNKYRTYKKKTVQNSEYILTDFEIAVYKFIIDLQNTRDCQMITRSSSDYDDREKFQQNRAFF